MSSRATPYFLICVLAVQKYAHKDNPDSKELDRLERELEQMEIVHESDNLFQE